MTWMKTLALVMLCGATAMAIEPARILGPLADRAGSEDSAKSSDGEVERRVLRLVQTHLPQLESVLQRLRADQPREYLHALRDLARSAKRLEATKKRDERLYEIEVDVLQSQTDVNLLTATLKVRDSQRDRKRLREAAARLQQSLIDRSAYDVDVLTQRLEKTQQQLRAAQQRLEAKSAQSDEQIEQAYLGMLKKAGRE